MMDFGCNCHLRSKLQRRRYISMFDSLMVDISTHFYLSIKRKEELEVFLLVCQCYIQAHIGTCRNQVAELLRVITYILELWPAILYQPPRCRKAQTNQD